MHTVFALLCFVVVIHWLIFPYPSGLLHWYCGNLTIAPVQAKQPWWIWINTSCEFIMNDCITTIKQSTTKPCAYFLGYTVIPCTLVAIGEDDNAYIESILQLYSEKDISFWRNLNRLLYRKLQFRQLPLQLVTGISLKLWLCRFSVSPRFGHSFYVSTRLVCRAICR